MQINKYNIAYKQKQGHKSYNHFNGWCKKKLWQNSTSLHDKSPKEIWTKGSYLNIIWAIYDDPIANIILNGENWKHFF
jgi:hypothetical protein